MKANKKFLKKELIIIKIFKKFKSMTEFDEKWN